MSPFAWFQYLLPQHLLTRAVGLLAQSSSPFIKTPLIRAFMKAYTISLDEYEVQRVEDFAHFNDFFTRALKPGMRPLSEVAGALSCPADGRISELGSIHCNQILQAKGKTYTLAKLLGGMEEASWFENGHFCTVYLAPSNYHRVHMPLSGRAIKSRYVPGNLFSVNQTTAENVPNLFARNERWIGLFETEHNGETLPFVVVMVGAMIVAGIETTLTGKINNTGKVQDFAHSDRVFKQGEELGRFYLGSTAIVITPPELCLNWSQGLQAGSVVQLNQTLGNFKQV